MRRSTFCRSSISRAREAGWSQRSSRPAKTVRMKSAGVRPDFACSSRASAGEVRELGVHRLGVEAIGVSAGDAGHAGAEAANDDRRRWLRFQKAGVARPEPADQLDRLDHLPGAHLVALDGLADRSAARRRRASAGCRRRRCRAGAGLPRPPGTWPPCWPGRPDGGWPRSAPAAPARCAESPRRAPSGLSMPPARRSRRSHPDRADGPRSRGRRIQPLPQRPRPRACPDSARPSESRASPSS